MFKIYIDDLGEKMMKTVIVNTCCWVNKVNKFWCQLQYYN